MGPAVEPLGLGVEFCSTTSGAVPRRARPGTWWLYSARVISSSSTVTLGHSSLKALIQLVQVAPGRASTPGQVAHRRRSLGVRSRGLPLPAGAPLPQRRRSCRGRAVRPLRPVRLRLIPANFLYLHPPRLGGDTIQGGGGRSLQWRPVSASGDPAPAGDLPHHLHRLHASGEIDVAGSAHRGLPHRRRHSRSGDHRRASEARPR